MHLSSKIIALSYLTATLNSSLLSAPDSAEAVRLGKLTPRSANMISSSLISVGTEMMDRDYTIYKNWKNYLGPLGVKKARVQSGWAKCEKTAGRYDWSWLDEIIFDMVAQGVEPWIDLCYGNPIYPGGGGTTLKDKALPSSEEALIAWEKYVKAIVTRYKKHVDEWEVWNEPNYGIKPDEFGRFALRTAQAIKSVQPAATVIGLALGSGVNFQYADAVLAEIKKHDGLQYVDQIIHHRHITVPENDEPEQELERVVDKYSGRIVVRQGEAGCPSKASDMFAMKNQDWNEIQQAKHILRRLMYDLARSKETSIFTIIDARYDFDGKPVWNYKGLIAATETLEVSNLKPAYYALQNATSIFDSTLKPISHYAYETADSNSNLFVFAHESIYSRKQAVVFWHGNQKPTLALDKQNTDFTFWGGNFTLPVLVDLLSGDVHEISVDQWTRTGNTYRFRNIPTYDAPMLIIDKSLITITADQK